MTGNVANGRPGPSEATRYTYLHFGGLGVSFNAKQDHQFVGLKQAGGSTDEQQMKLMADTKPGDEAAPFFSVDGEKEAALKHSLCYPFRRPRYWYSGPDADEEKLVYVYSDSPTNSKVMYRGEVIFSSISNPVLSAAIFDDPLEGECLFVVSASSRYEHTYNLGGYVEMVLDFPITGTVIRVKNKAQIRTWTKRASDYPKDSPLILTSFENNGSHTLDGAKFVQVLHRVDEYSGTIVDMVFSIDSQGEIALEQEIPGRYQLTGGESSSSWSRQSTMTPPNPHSFENFSREKTSVSRDARSYDHTGSMVFCREMLHDGTVLDCEVEGHFAYSYVLNKSFTSTDVITQANLPAFSDAIFHSNGSGDEEIHSTASHKVKLWDDVGLVISLSTLTSSTSQTSEFDATTHSIYGVNPSIQWSTSTTNTYSYTSTTVSEEVRRDIEAWCVHSKSVWVRCSSEKITTTAIRTGTRSYVDTHLETSVRPPYNGTEIVTESVKKRWMELLVGDQVTVFNEVEIASTITTLVVPFDGLSGGWDLFLFAPTGEEDGSSSEVLVWAPIALETIDWPITTSTVVSGNWYDWAVNGMFAAKNAHMIGLNGKAIIAVPRYYYGTNYPTEAVKEVKSVPDPGEWLVRITPSEAEVGAASELSSSPESFTFVSTVYPTE